MTGVALLNRQMNRLRNQNHESNDGFPLHPSLIQATSMNKTGYKPLLGDYKLLQGAKIRRGGVLIEIKL